MKKLRDLIKEILDEKNALRAEGENKFKIADVARQMDITPQSLNSMLNRNSPTVANLQKIADAIDIDASRLLSYSNTASNAKMANQTPDYIEVPYVSVQARATIVEQGGYGYPETMDTYPILREAKTEYGNSFVFEINGDSMEPTINSGSKILCITVDQSNWQYINSGLYVVQFADYLLLKRIKSNDLLTKGYLELHSDNANGGSVTVKEEDLRRIWKYRATVYAIAK